MRETKTHTIGEHVYAITQLGAKEGRVVLARVIRAVAGAAEAAEPVAKLAAALTDAEVNFLCDTFAKTTMVGRADTPQNQVPLADQFDNHFAGNYGALIKWLWAALETNYASFLDELGLNAGALAEAAKAGAKGLGSTPISPTSLSGALSSRASGV